MTSSLALSPSLAHSLRRAAFPRLAVLVAVFLFIFVVGRSGPDSTAEGLRTFSAAHAFGLRKRDTPEQAVFGSHAAQKQVGAAVQWAGEFEDGEVVVYELGVHDEVTGAIGYSMNALGVKPTYNCLFRHQFPTVLAEAVGYEPTVITPHGHKAPMNQWLKEDKVKHLVLTTCTDSLPRLRDALLKSSAHVTCLIHHSGGSFTKHRELLQPLVMQDRLSIVVLGEHVRQRIQFDVDEWAEKLHMPQWERVKVEVMLPVFDYPHVADRSYSHVYPSNAIIQGNIEYGRRDYKTVFADLVREISADPALWGYSVAEPGSPFVADDSPNASPFHMWLLGSASPADKNPVIIPVELKDTVVSLKERLAYPEYYDLIARADLLIPAFAQSSNYQETTSSSIASAAIARTPILVSERHLGAYTYMRDAPGVSVQRNISQSDISAVRELRKGNVKWSPPTEQGWNALQQEVTRQNAEMWARVLSR